MNSQNNISVQRAYRNTSMGKHEFRPVASDSAPQETAQKKEFFFRKIPVKESCLSTNRRMAREDLLFWRQGGLSDV